MNTSTTPSPLILFYHRIPHLYKNFTKLHPNHYNPFNQLYIESLGIIASLPALLLIIILLNLLIYLTSFCCCRQRSSKCFGFVRFCLFLGVAGCCALIGLTLYLNDELNESVRKLVNCIRRYEGNLGVIRNRTEESLGIIENNVELNLKNIQRHYSEAENTTEDTHAILTYISTINYNLTLNYDLLATIGASVSVTNYAQILATIESYRWSLMLGFYIVFLVFNVLLVYGILRSSKCSFITFSVAGLLLLIVNWCIVSGWLVIAVASADTCISHHICPTCSLLSSLLPTPHLTQSLSTIQSTLNSIRTSTKDLRSHIHFNYNYNYIELNIINLFEYYSTLELYLSNVGSTLELVLANYAEFRGLLCGGGIWTVHWLLLVNGGICGLLGFVVYVDSWIWIYLIQQRSSNGWRSGCPSAAAADSSRLIDEKYSTAAELRHSRGTGCPPTHRLQHSHPTNEELFIGGVGGRATATLDHRHHPQQPRHQNGKYKTLNKNCKLLDSSDYY